MQAENTTYAQDLSTGKELSRASSGDLHRTLAQSASCPDDLSPLSNYKLASSKFAMSFAPR